MICKTDKIGAAWLPATHWRVASGGGQRLWPVLATPYPADGGAIKEPAAMRPRPSAVRPFTSALSEWSTASVDDVSPLMSQQIGQQPPRHPAEQAADPQNLLNVVGPRASPSPLL
jgi:hypothetical protein